MENPATWGPAEKAVRTALDADHRANLRPEPLCGLSLPRRITDALREAGLLAPEQPQELDEAAMAVLHQMRDSFCTAKDRLRDTGTISQEDYEKLAGEFFDGYQQVKKLLQR